MGSRRDFIKAMLFGVVIGIAVTTAFFQLRGGEANISATPKSATPGSGCR